MDGGEGRLYQMKMDYMRETEEKYNARARRLFENWFSLLIFPF